MPPQPVNLPPPQLSAALRAIGEDARWQALDLLGRRGGDAVDLLRGYSGELALSRSAREQLLGLALDRAAAAIACAEAIPLLDLSEFLVARPLPDAVVAAIRRRSAALYERDRQGLHCEACAMFRQGSAPADAAALSRARQFMAEDAALNRLLWCDTRIVLHQDARAAMLASAAVLDEAAAALASHPPWWRRLLDAVRCRVRPRNPQ